MGNGIAVNSEGVRSLKEYSRKITDAVGEIKSASDSMANVTDQHSGKIGPHAGDIKSALDTIKGAVLRGVEPANNIAEKLNEVAEAYQEIIDGNYYGGSGN